MTEFGGQALRRTVASRVLAASLVVLGGLAWLVVLMVVLFIVPKFVAIFADFDVKLPQLSQAIICASRVVGQNSIVFGALWLIVVPGLAVLLAATSWRWAVGLAAAFAGVSLVGTVMALVLTVLGLFLPLISLLESMKGAK